MINIKMLHWLRNATCIKKSLKPNNQPLAQAFFKGNLKDNEVTSLFYDHVVANKNQAC